MARVGNKCKLGIDTQINSKKPMGFCKCINLYECMFCDFNLYDECERVHKIIEYEKERENHE